MRLTTHDRPIGQAVASAVFSPTVTAAELARQYGLHPQSICMFRRRHPELKHWPLERVAQQIVANKNQSDVAKRQGQAEGGNRGKFGRMVYE